MRQKSQWDQAYFDLTGLNSFYFHGKPMSTRWGKRSSWNSLSFRSLVLASRQKSKANLKQNAAQWEKIKRWPHEGRLLTTRREDIWYPVKYLEPFQRKILAQWKRCSAQSKHITIILSININCPQWSKSKTFHRISYQISWNKTFSGGLEAKT